MALIVDHEHLGPSEARWYAAGHRDQLASFGPVEARRLAMVSPHPNDDVLGAAALPASLIRRFWCSYEVYVDEMASTR